MHFSTAETLKASLQPQVLLVGTMPLERRTSMEIYRQELERYLSDYLATPAAQAQPQLAGLQVRSGGPGWSTGTNGGRWANGLSKLNRYLWQPLALAGRVRRPGTKQQPPTLVHILDHSYAHLGVGLPARQLLVTVHDLILLLIKEGTVPLGPGDRVGRTLRSFEFSMGQLRRAPLLITNSHTTARDLTRLVGIEPGRIRPIYLGIGPQFRPIDDAAQLDRLRTRYNLPPRFLLHVGQSRLYKNLPTLFETLARLQRAWPDLHLVKAGERLTEQQHLRLKELNIGHRVIELGRVPEADLPGLYNLAVVLAFPSTYEGFGWPPVEAMACGRPAIVSDAGALPEVVGAGAIVLPASESARWAEEIDHLLRDEEWYARWRRAGLSQAGRYRWQETARQTAQVYEELLEGYDAKRL